MCCFEASQSVKFPRIADERQEHTIQEESASLVVRCNALQKGKCIANSIRSRSSKLGRVKQGIYRDDLLK
jgi:hypothetical protein